MVFVLCNTPPIAYRTSNFLYCQADTTDITNSDHQVVIAKQFIVRIVHRVILALQ